MIEQKIDYCKNERKCELREKKEEEEVVLFLFVLSNITHIIMHVTHMIR